MHHDSLRLIFFNGICINMNTWQFILNKLSTSVDVVLLYVLESRGSSPGRQGFHMAVAADNQMKGTIGGGIMEHKFAELAKSMLDKNEQANRLFKQVHDKSAKKDHSGMICSGEQTVFLYQVKQHEKECIAELINSLRENRNGTLYLSQSGMSFRDEKPDRDYFFERIDETNFFYTEKTGFRYRLHIIGGGHCSLALSKLLEGMGFYISLYEVREGLNTMEENVFVQEKHMIDSYEQLSGLIEGGYDVFVVIMTFGYRTDDLALRALMEKKFRYIGMLGSKHKVEKMMQEYRAEKIDERLLKQVHAPAGIQIKSQTAGEIAISIAAELIAEKNKNQ